MSKKLVVGGFVALLVVGYGVYAKFFMTRVPIGELCQSSGYCDGECLAFGDLLPDYSHKELCTRACKSNDECPEPTTCEQVNLLTTDGKGGATQSVKGFCLPAVVE